MSEPTDPLDKIMIEGQPAPQFVFALTNPNINFTTGSSEDDASRLQDLITHLDLSRLPFSMSPSIERFFPSPVLIIRFEVRDACPPNRGQLLTLYFRAAIQMRRTDGAKLSPDQVYAQIHRALLKLLEHELNECLFVDGRRYMPDDGVHGG